MSAIDSNPRQATLATLCYVQRDDKTLMMLRNKKLGDVHMGKWNGLGGKFLPGENPENCVRREIKEESGLIVTDLRLRGVISFPLFTPQRDWYTFLYTATAESADFVDCHEGTLSWIPTTKS